MIWYERFLECSRTQGTSEFSKSVWRFYSSLLNLDDKELAIKSKVDDYVDNIWKPEIKKVVRNHIHGSTNSGIINAEWKIVEKQNIHLVFDFIIQTIQDSGLGWPTKDDIQRFQISQE